VGGVPAVTKRKTRRLRDMGMPLLEGKMKRAPVPRKMEKKAAREAVIAKAPAPVTVTTAAKAKASKSKQTGITKACTTSMPYIQHTRTRARS
jgi:hypothetical protein